MRKVFFSTLLGTLLGIALATTGCKKENKEAAPAGGSAAGSAAPAAKADKADPAADPVAPSAVAPGEPVAPPATDPGPRPAALTDADIALADKLVDSIRQMMGAINDAGTDCPKVAASIKAMSAEMKSVAEEGKQLSERIGGDEAARKWFEATYAPQIMAIMGKFSSTACYNDKVVQEAMASVQVM